MRRVVSPFIVVAIFGFAAAVLYRHLWDDPTEGTLANYLRSGVHGMAVALGGWGCHAWFSARAGAWLRRWPLLAEVALRALAIAVAVAAVLVWLQPVLYGEPLEAKWFEATFPGVFAAAVVLSIAFSALYELVRLIGGRVLLAVILGRYRHPVREERVLMFLDLAGSTALAESLGEVRLQELLTRFFFDIDEPIVAHGGEVHAYVGDAVIVTWPLAREGRGPAARCLDCFFAVEERIEKAAPSYRAAFGWVPRFRGALHAGPVVISECGESRRQIAYFGDTMNVTARLQERAKEAGRSLLVSAALLERVRPGPDLRVEALGQAALRGRAAAVEVFAIERGQPATAGGMS
jgi:class 3 adenylate cyclase